MLRINQNSNEDSQGLHCHEIGEWSCNFPSQIAWAQVPACHYERRKRCWHFL